MTSPDPRHANLSPGDGDALDQWLESMTAGEPAGRSSAPEPGSLQAVAARYHAAIAAAEAARGPSIPVDELWERIMPTITPVPATGTVSMPDASQPRRTTPSRPLPGILTGSHWAVSAAMVVAVAIGIVALYRSFADDGSRIVDYGPATNPAFAASTPATPDGLVSEDIDRWLADPATADCERVTDPDNLGGDVANWATDRPKEVESYLPFGPVAVEDQQAVADRMWSIAANCAPTADDPVTSHDFGWMPGRGSGVTPTAEQMVRAQEISAALPMQDYASYFIVRESSPQATPTADGQTVGRYVLLPQDVVKLADGRVGGPLRYYIEADDPDKAIANLTGGVEYAPVVFVIFTNVNQQWLYDELITLCVGDCAAYWDEIAGIATPAPATGDDAYLAAFIPQECDVDGIPDENDEVSAELGNPLEPGHQDDGFLGPQPTNPDEGFAPEVDPTQDILPAMTEESGLPPRQYGPRDPASEADALAVADANRAWQACTFWGSPSTIIALQSGRFQAYPVDDTLGSELDALTRELLQGDASRYIVIAGERGTTIAQGDDMSTLGAGYALPSQAIVLGDGRIAVPVTRVVPLANHTGPPATIDVRIFIQDPARDGRWVLDEIVRLCAGGCDETPAGIDVSPAEGTPAASDPNAHWLQDPALNHCAKATTDPFPATIETAWDALVARYLPFAAAPEPMRMQIASHYLLLQTGCAPNEAGIPAVSDEFRGILPPGEGATREQVELAMAISAALPNHDDPLAYVVEGEALPANASDPPGSMASSRPVMLPDDVVVLPDGRLGAPLRQFVQTNHPDGVEGWVGQAGYVETIFAIFAEEDGVWAFDEVLPVCLGDCDDYWAFYLASTQGTPGASPVASPVAIRPD